MTNCASNQTPGKSADVSVIMTCFNEGRYILAAVESVLAQTAQERIVEIIIVDDGSAEETREVLRQIPALDPRVTVLFQANAGLPASRNRAIGLSKGTWIAILDADDLWTPEKLQLQLAVVAADASVGLVYTDFFNVDPDDVAKRSRVRCTPYQPGTPDVLKKYFVHDAPIIPSTTLIRRDVFAKAGLFDATFRIAEDNEMWIRVIAAFRIAHVPEPLLLKRQRGNSLGSDAVRNMAFYDRITAKAVGLFPELASAAGPRRARRLAKAGQFLAAKGEKLAAWRNYRAALACDPGFRKLYGLSVLLLVPAAIETCLMNFARKARHG